MRHTLLGNVYRLAAARVAPGTGRPVADGEAAKPSNLDAVAVSQRFGHAVENGLDDHLGIAMGQLMELRCQRVNQIGSGHGDAS